ncbi:YCII-related domain-containing protein [Actinomadura mexicana]|uniref:YCII-related domain-containing protein n=2 Tax=Actinomadura mexicana TaxID=134959 RepID=A0A239CUH3_9ACTN|nr:YCII-related domain-containing protein [Actinomadura mexicana]
MKYLLLSYTLAAAWDAATAGAPSEEALAAFAEYQKFEQELTETGEFVASEGLGHPVVSTTVRRAADGVVATDGPFAELKEVLASFAVRELARVDLTREAIRLTRMLHAALPDDAEATSLLALMLLTDSRRHARTGADRELVPLDEQDRTRWDPDLIRAGTELIDSVWNRGAAGPYRLQAAIAAVHAAAASPEETDWPQIAMLYLWLERLTPTAPIRLSRVVAVAQAYGPARGLALLDDLNTRHHLDLDPLTRQRERAVRAHLLQMTGDTASAADLYRQAAALTGNQVEQRYLLGKAARLG